MKQKSPSHFCEGLLSGWQDSNLRPPAPKAGAITGLRYTPCIRFMIIKKRERKYNPFPSFYSRKKSTNYVTVWYL